MNVLANGFWWKTKDKRELSSQITSIVQQLDDSQKHITAANLRHLRLYGNFDLLGINVHGYSRGDSSIESRLRANLIQSVADTLANKISKNKPKPTFLTSGGDYSSKKKARLLDDFCEGLFYHDGSHQKGQEVFLDGAVWGTGCIKVIEKNGYPCSERVLSEEIKFDLADSFYGYPTTLYQTKFYNRDVALEMFEDVKGAGEAIRRSTLEDDRAISFTNVALSDQIKIIESWHLPSGPGANDGRHAIVCDGGTIIDEPWTDDCFPFVFYKLLPKRIGFWAQGVAENLTPLQIELNKLLRTLQLSMHLTCIPKILVEANSDIVDNHLNNQIGGIIKYLGAKPEYWAGGSIPGELFRQIDWTWDKGFQQFGISALSASSLKPSGLDAAVAIREYNDIETERFVLIGQRYEQFYVELARQYIRAMRRSARKAKQAGEKANKVRVPKRGYFVELDWLDIDLDEKDYMIQIFPTSSLPTRPEARKQTVQELAQAGWIGPEEALDLLDFPDLEGYASRRNAPVRDIERTIEAMIDNGKYYPPEPYQNLTLGTRMVQQAYLKARIEKVPEERLELMRIWIEDAQSLLDEAAASAAQPPAQGGVPMAEPMPPPTSELVPNVPTVQ